MFLLRCSKQNAINVVCTPQEYGGLGFSELADMLKPTRLYKIFVQPNKIKAKAMNVYFAGLR